MPKESRKADYDSPWKDILEAYFPQFMAFFFPQADAQIDWSQGYTFLDKELQQIAPDAETGSRRVDKLVKVYLLNGKEAWVLAHIEVQGQKEEEFPERIYIYNYRLFDKYKRRVASLAILSDDQADWRPDHYGYELFNCRVSLDFPAVKLLDYKDKWAELEANANPFAVVVMAHLQTRTTRRKPAKRYDAKLNLARMLYQRGYKRQQVLDLFRFIDWIMTLPPELEQQFRYDVEQLETEVKMRYVTSIERLAMEEGREEGREEGLQIGIRQSILGVLQARFGVVPAMATGRLEQVEDLERLQALLGQAVTADSLAAFEGFLASDEG